MDENRALFESGGARAGWNRAKRAAYSGLRCVALAAFGLCAATGAVIWTGFLLSGTNRALLARELSCLPPDALARLERASAAGGLWRPLPELRLVLADRAGEALLCFEARRPDGEAVPPRGTPGSGDHPEILTTLVVRASADGAPVPE